MSFNLQGQGAIITGAARGIGLAVARRFAKLGAKVSGWDLGCSAIAEDPAFVHRADVDITDEAAVNVAFEETAAALGQVSILVANAGINGPAKPTWEYSLEEWQRTIDVDLTGVFLSVKPAVMHMRTHDYGRIVIMASVAGKEGNKGACAYAAANRKRRRKSLPRQLGRRG